MFQPALGFKHHHRPQQNHHALPPQESWAKTFIKIIEPGIKDRLVADHVLAVHNEHRVGRKAAQHLTINQFIEWL